MPRTKGGVVSRRRRNRVLKQAKGFFGSKHCLYKVANQQVMKSLVYAYRDRKNNKRNFRKLWIVRINAASRALGLSYNQLMHGLKLANVDINRKMLSELAIFAPEEFTKLVKLSKDALEGKTTTVAEKVEKKVEKAVEAAKDYAKLTVAELKAECEKAGIEITSAMKKADLINALKK